MTQEYIAKVINNGTGLDLGCWVATQMFFDLTSWTGFIRLLGYVNIQDRLDHHPHQMQIVLPIPDLAAIEGQVTIHAAVVQLIISSPQFSGATLETIEVQ